MDWFVEDLDRWSYAEEAKDAVENVTGERPRTKSNALEELEKFVNDLDEAALTELLGYLQAGNLVAWARECVSWAPTCGRADVRAKGPAIHAILRAYFFENEEVEEDDPEEAGANFAAYRSAEYSAMFFKELAPRSTSVVVRDYQQEAIEAAIRAAQPESFFLVHVATGGGKTLIGNDVVAEFVRRGQSVLWVTKDWELLKQAAQDLCSRHDHVGRPGRIGGSDRPLHPLPEDTGSVRYTTIQTLGRRGASGLRGFRPGLVVWDECHWGEEGKAGSAIKKLFARRKIPVFGLTATPKTDSRFEVVFSRTFAELVNKQWLARPIVVDPVATGVNWAPELDVFGDYAARSVRELAMTADRNKRIVEHWVTSAAKYGKTIVFACFIDHAEVLKEAFVKRGIAVRVIHSGLPNQVNADSLRKFKAGEVTVLVNVVKLTHGIDVPDARTVLLTRPTTSDILFAQMVGRASRRAEGKDSFHIVEFTDNVQRHGEHLYSAKKFYQGAGFDLGIQPASDRPAVRRKHGLSVHGLPTWIPGTAASSETRGLWFRQNQSFGIELELTRDGFTPDMSERRWTVHAEELRKRLAEKLGSRVAPEPIPHYESASGEKDYSVWHVERDDSAGWEVTSPVLQNAEGFAEVVDACHAIEDAIEHAGFKVHWKTGFHLHLGWRPDEGARIGLEETKKLVQLVRLFEPALGTLVAPSRISEFDGTQYDLSRPNRYCAPLSSVFGRTALAGLASMDDMHEHVESRYAVLNLMPLSTIGTVEVRMHNGTADAGKVLLWTSLWQQLLWAAEHGPALPDVDDREVIVPDGDILDLARRFLPDHRQPEQQVLLERLHRRRRQVLQSWQEHPELRGWTQFAGRWSAL